MDVKEIEAAITRLSPRQLAELAAWFGENYNNEWDRQIEEVLDARRLDSFIAEAEEEYDAGKAKQL